jgi:eukaryotic-like serine/threonine-protein kinase
MTDTSFKEIKLLGEGGLARVALVEDGAGNLWAKKELLPKHTDPKVISRFRNEVRILAVLKHANIVPIAGASLESDRPWYLMPVADGSLELEYEQFVGKPDALVPVARQILDAICYAHALPLDHRDIKPQNVLRYGPVYKVSDFGLSRSHVVERTFKTSTGESWTSGWFSPPEQYLGLDRCDSRSDIFSLGRMFLYCLTGRTPAEVPKDVDPRWKYIISKCVRDDPSDRWPSASVLRQQFELVFSLGDAITIDAENVLACVAELAKRVEAIGAAQIASLSQLLAPALADHVLIRRVFAALPKPLIDAWIAHDLTSFKEVLSTFDKSISPFEDFAYCDVIADQYLLVHSVCQDLDVRKLVRTRLFNLGPSHNRWHVGEVLAKMLATVRSAADIADVMTLIESDPVLADWHRRYLQRTDIAEQIREKLPK